MDPISILGLVIGALTLLKGVRVVKVGLHKEFTSPNGLDNSTTFPKPPNYAKLPDKWKDVSYWQNLGALSAKTLAAQYCDYLEKNPELNEMPSNSAFKSAYQEICGNIGIPYSLVRAIHSLESYDTPRPLDLNRKTTALGLGQFLLGSSSMIGVPYILQTYWKTAIWSTATLLKKKGFPDGFTLSFGELDHAISVAGTKSEPAWFKAVRYYYSSDTATSTDYATKVFKRYLDGFDANTKMDSEKWHTMPHKAKLAKFLDGSATNVNAVG